MNPLHLAFVLASVLLVLLSHMASSAELASVSYYYPCDSSDSGCGWDQLISLQNSTGAIGFALINPDSGPGTEVNADYTSLVARCNAVPLKLFGYVHTSYGDRNITEVKDDISSFYSFYPGIHGIFLDEVSDLCNETVYYQELYDYIKSLQSTATVVLNPGTNVPECFVNCSDILVTFESPLSYFTDYVASSWNADYPTTRFWQIVYDVPESELAATLTKMISNHAGYVFVSNLTGVNPYDANPAYLNLEVSLIVDDSPTTSTSSSSTSTTTSSSGTSSTSTTTSTTTTSSATHTYSPNIAWSAVFMLASAISVLLF